MTDGEKVKYNKLKEELADEKKVVKELKAELKEKSEELVAATETIEELNQELSAKDAEGVSKTPTLVHKNKTYNIAIPKVNLSGVIYNVADMKDNKDGCVDSIFKIEGQGILVEA